MEKALLSLVASLLAAFLIAPLAALIAGVGLHELKAGLDHPLVWPALKLSAQSTFISLAFVVALGTPLAWGLGRAGGGLARMLESLVQLPMLIPPSVAGVAMLLLFGRRGMLSTFLGGWLWPQGGSLTGSLAAVVMVQVFVATPFYLQGAIAGFREIDEGLLVAARSFGTSPLRLFFRLAIPMSTSTLLAAALMAWARALGEFGATLMFAGNIEGLTQTLPLAIYTVLESDLAAARAISVLLVSLSFSLFLGVRGALLFSERRRGWEAGK